MYNVLYDPWLVSIISQVLGGVISGLIVVSITQSRLPAHEIEKLFGNRVKVPVGSPFSFFINKRYLFFYIVILSGIAAFTIFQDPSAINMFAIIIYVIVVTWWSMVALNIFALMDGAILEGHLPNVIKLFGSIIFPIIGHTKSLAYVLFAFITKFSFGLLLYGISIKFIGWDVRIALSLVLACLAIVDTFFYAYLFLPEYPEFSNWRNGRFIIDNLSM